MKRTISARWLAIANCVLAIFSLVFGAHVNGYALSKWGFSILTWMIIYCGMINIFGACISLIPIYSFFISLLQREDFFLEHVVGWVCMKYILDCSSKCRALPLPPMFSYPRREHSIHWTLVLVHEWTICVLHTLSTQHVPSRNPPRKLKKKVDEICGFISSCSSSREHFQHISYVVQST